MIFGIGALLCFYGIRELTGSHILDAACPPSGYKVPRVQDEGRVKRINQQHRQENIKPVRSRVYKPISLVVGEGATTVVEIDHGLRPVDRFKGERYSDDVEKGKRKGAMGAITVRVVDTTGIPVAGAKVFGGFWSNNPDDRAVAGASDENGEITFEHLCTGDFNFSVTKDGYYRTTLRYWFFKTGFDCAKNGRWLPWNPTLEVVLKEKRNPTAMYMKYVDTRVPIQDTPVGFDLETGDWITPYGKGRSSNMQVTYKHTMETGVWRINCTVAFTNLTDGAYQFQQDVYSLLRSSYHADDSAEYEHAFDFVYERTNDKILQHKRIGDDAGLIFRVHCETAHGTSGLHYGKIYGPIEFIEAGLMNIRFSYLFNPVENDTNLEFDGAGYKGGWR